MGNSSQLGIFDVIDYSDEIHFPIKGMSEIERLIYAARNYGHHDMIEKLEELKTYFDILIAQEFCDEHDPIYDTDGWTCRNCLHAEIYEVR